MSVLSDSLFQARDITVRPLWQTSAQPVVQALSALQLRDLKQSNSCNLTCKPKWWLSVVWRRLPAPTGRICTLQLRVIALSSHHEELVGL